MTQDPWGQPRPAGYVVRGEVVPDSESGASGAGQAPPMTHFQKVASALRGDQPGQPADQSEEPVSPDEDEARTEEVRAVSSPDNGRDYWDVDGVEDEPAEDPAASAAEDPAASVTEDTAASASARPADAETAPSAPAGLAEDEPGDEAGPDAHDATDPSMTQPDIFGTPRPTAASIPTVPIALTEEPDGAAGRHAAAAAPGVTAAEAATSAEAGQAERLRPLRLRPLRLRQLRPRQLRPQQLRQRPQLRLRRRSCGLASPGRCSAVARAGTRA